MYYYLLEQRPSERLKRTNDRLSDQLTDTGIAGEMVSQSALKTIPDLLDIGLEKGYSTIVAVGSDRHIHEVIRGLMRYGREDRPVLGAIPTDTNSLVANLIGAPNLVGLLGALKLRRLVHASLAQISSPTGDGQYLLTQATLQPPRPMEVIATIETAQVRTRSRLVMVTGDGQLEIHSVVSGTRRVGRALAWLVGVTLPEQTVSLFHGQTIELASEIPVPLVGYGQTLTQTPCMIQIVRRALKLIVVRATVALSQT